MAEDLAGDPEMEMENNSSEVSMAVEHHLKSEEIQDQRNLHLVLDGSSAAKEGLNFEVNLQPEKIVEVFNLSDGTKSYRVRWKDTWIHEQLIASYQHLVDEFWVINNKTEIEKNSKKIDFTLGSDSIKIEENSVDVMLVPTDENTDHNAKPQSDEEELNFDETPNEQNENGLQEKNVGSLEEENNDRKSTKRKASGGSKKSNKKPRKSGKVRKLKKEKDDEKENQDESTENNDQNTNTDEKPGNEGASSGTSKEKKEKFQYGEDKGPCSCDICGKVISNKYGLREHQAVVHFKNGRFECDICGKRVTNKRALNLHKTSHSNERKFICDQCGSSHKTKGNLNYHIKTMHTMIKNFRCDICFKTFKVQAELKEHCFSVHANAGVITCIVCKKKLTTALSIYTHSVMHSGAREYECDICGYAFKTLTGLKEHKITHSDNKPIRHCPYCERKFYSRSQYNAHVMRHTADGTLITYKCPICEVKFQHKSSYNRHVIRHQPGGDLEFPKENPYLLLDEADLPEGVCHKCRKYYSSKSGFYLHLKKCRDGIIQQFRCIYCERGCSNRSSLKRHIQRRHKGMEFDGQQGQEMIHKDNVENDGVSQTTVMTTQDGLQYQGAYFDHGYGNQITTVDVSQLPTVDVQLLIDTAAAQGDGQTHIISNVGQLQGEETTQNLHILSGHEAAQFAAQLSQAGVIVQSSEVTHDNQEQQLIVSSAQIDARTGQIIVNADGQTAQIIANTDALSGAQLDQEDGGLLQTDERNAILRDQNVLHFNNRATVIQIQHPTNDITNQQVLAITEQQLQENSVEVDQLEGRIESHSVVSDLQHMDDESVGELPPDMNSENIDGQQFIQGEQIVSNLSDNDVDHEYDSMSMLKLTQG